jgi:hypothetical protein
MSSKAAVASIVLTAGMAAYAGQAELTGVTQVRAGSTQACALTSAGGVRCWGKGPFGDGTEWNLTRSVAAEPLGLGGGVVSIGVGPSHTCAVLASGGIKCWGFNFSGQLGNGASSDWPAVLVPVDVINLPGPAVDVSPGSAFTCALLASGGVHCWGSNSSGQLGGNSLTSGVVALDAGSAHACALMSNGAVKCWGANGSGQLGDGTTVDRFAPVDVQSLGSGVASISASHMDYSCAVTSQGGAKCWGANPTGAFDDTNSAATHLTPFDVFGLTSGMSSIAAGGITDFIRVGIYTSVGMTCALPHTGNVKCWGGREAGLHSFWSYPPTDIVGLMDPTSITVGGLYGCAVVTGVRCAAGLQWALPSR